MPNTQKDEAFKQTVLGWIAEELNKVPGLQSVSAPVHDDIIELTVADMIVEESTTAVFKCDRCLYHGVVKRELLESQAYIFCPRCDNTLFDQELLK